MPDDDKTDPPETDPGGEQSEEDRLDSLENRLDHLAEQLEKLIPGGKSGGEGKPAATVSETSAQRADSLRSEMRDAISEHDRQKRTDSELRRLAKKVNDVAAKVVEIPPRQWRKVEQLMGWPDKES